MQRQAKSQSQPPLQLLGDPHKEQAAHLLHMCRGHWFGPNMILNQAEDVASSLGKVFAFQVQGHEFSPCTSWKL